VDLHRFETKPEGRGKQRQFLENFWPNLGRNDKQENIMKKLKKLLLIAGIGLVVLLVLVALTVGLFLDNIVKKGMETVGPRVTQVSINVDAIKISLLGGSAEVKGLVVGNPQGYKLPQAISVGLAKVAVSPGSLLGDKIVVKEVSVDGPEITFEGGIRDNNLTQIQKNVNDFVAGLTGGPATNAPVTASGKPAAPAKKLEVDHFIISNAKVHGTLRLLGTDVPLPTLPLPTIELTDLGTGPDGITPADLVQKVLSAITTSTLKAVGDAAADLGKGALSGATGAGKAVGGGVSNLGKSLGGLFGK